MSKSSKLTDAEKQELRDVQTESMQALLFTLRELGETSALLQLEFDGVLHFIAARQLTQGEFDQLVRQAVCES